MYYFVTVVPLTFTVPFAVSRTVLVAAASAVAAPRVGITRASAIIDATITRISGLRNFLMVGSFGLVGVGL